MQIRWLTAFLDFNADDFGSEVTYWRAIAGCTVSPPRGPRREFATLEPFNGDAHLRVQRLESGPGGIHLDFHVDDPRTAAITATDLGATIVADHREYLTLESPGGFVFCLVPTEGNPRRSRPIRWPEDTISIIDQVCIDIPAGLFAREVTFWAQLTGWPTIPSQHPEFVPLRRDPRIAIGILLQRLDSDDAADDAHQTRVTAHLDVATTSVPDEVARHTDWGAEVVAEFRSWTVMSDPSGRPYCVTDRNPRTGH